MPTLNIGGTRVKVDDSFLSMTAEQQNAAVEEIAGSLPQIAQPRGQQDGSLSADNAARSFATGVPIIGGALNKIDAATNATLAPLIDPLLPDSFQKLPGQTWHERYQQALDIQNGKDSAFESEHPYVDTGLNVAGAVGGMVPAVMAAPTAFGAGGGGLIGRTLWSAGSGATIGGADSAIRSDGEWAGRGLVHWLVLSLVRSPPPLESLSARAGNVFVISGQQRRRLRHPVLIVVRSRPSAVPFVMMVLIRPLSVSAWVSLAPMP